MPALLEPPETSLLDSAEINSIEITSSMPHPLTRQTWAEHILEANKKFIDRWGGQWYHISKPTAMELRTEDLQARLLNIYYNALDAFNALGYTVGPTLEYNTTYVPPDRLWVGRNTAFPIPNTGEAFWYTRTWEGPPTEVSIVHNAGRQNYSCPLGGFEFPKLRLRKGQVISRAITAHIPRIIEACEQWGAFTYSQAAKNAYKSLWASMLSRLGEIWSTNAPTVEYKAVYTILPRHWQLLGNLEGTCWRDGGEYGRSKYNVSRCPGVFAVLFYEGHTHDEDIKKPYGDHIPGGGCRNAKPIGRCWGFTSPNGITVDNIYGDVHRENVKTLIEKTAPAAFGLPENITLTEDCISLYPFEDMAYVNGCPFGWQAGRSNFSHDIRNAASQLEGPLAPSQERCPNCGYEDHPDDLGLRTCECGTEICYSCAYRCEDCDTSGCSDCIAPSDCNCLGRYCDGCRTSADNECACGDQLCEHCAASCDFCEAVSCANCRTICPCTAASEMRLQRARDYLRGQGISLIALPYRFYLRTEERAILEEEELTAHNVEIPEGITPSPDFLRALEIAKRYGLPCPPMDIELPCRCAVWCDIDREAIRTAISAALEANGPLTSPEDES